MHNCLMFKEIKTPAGQMVAVGDNEALYLLEFVTRKGFQAQLERLKKATKREIVEGTAKAIIQIEKELLSYFKGELKVFKTPVKLTGTPFQQAVWRKLQKIPYGKTLSYMELAASIGHPTAFRAVASANGANKLAIILACHRVINANGKLGGYAAGLACKKWLLDLETS